MNWFSSLFGKNETQEPDTGVQSITVDQLSAYAGQQHYSNFQNSIYDGEKFEGGFGETQLYDLDYETLRARSDQIFNENLYAQGLIERLVTNVINTGIMPESSPDERVLGVAPGTLGDWSDDAESQFGVWAKSPEAVDYLSRQTWSGLQRTIYREAMISGDILVILRVNNTTNMPYVQLVKAGSIQSPMLERDLPKTNTVTYGVEQDKNGRIVAYHIAQDDGSFKRQPAYGSKTGRRLAWLVTGMDLRLGDVRGVPILGVVLQSLKEIDRYRDSVQRKAVINSILAMFIKKDKDKISTLPVTNSAAANASKDTESPTRKLNIAEQVPGVIYEELQEGETPEGFHTQGIDLDFGKFESAIIQAVAWARNVPPEVLTMAFSNNYSASQAAINEFKIFVSQEWNRMGEQFGDTVFQEFLVSSALKNDIRAPGLLKAWRGGLSEYLTFGAWSSARWYGAIKLSTDVLKQAKGSELLVKNAWSTNARESRVNTGTKWDTNVTKVHRENEKLAAALRPMLELKQQFGGSEVESAIKGSLAEVLDNVNESNDG